MKLLKISLLVVCSLLVFIACKKEQNTPEEVIVEYKEEEKKPIAENATIATTKFNIEGMTCAVGCAAKIEKSLVRMEGVASAKVDYDAKTAEVSYDVDLVSTELLTERVAKNGSQYKVSNMQTITSKK